MVRYCNAVSSWMCNRSSPSAFADVGAKNCQRRGWQEKGHQAGCKLLQDTDLKAMFALRWDEFHGHLSFPLSVEDSDVGSGRKLG
jgi:hypothetical protein